MVESETEKSSRKKRKKEKKKKKSAHKKSNKKDLSDDDDEKWFRRKGVDGDDDADDEGKRKGKSDEAASAKDVDGGKRKGKSDEAASAKDVDGRKRKGKSDEAASAKDVDGGKRTGKSDEAASAKDVDGGKRKEKSDEGASAKHFDGGKRKGKSDQAASAKDVDGGKRKGKSDEAESAKDVDGGNRRKVESASEKDCDIDGGRHRKMEATSSSKSSTESSAKTEDQEIDLTDAARKTVYVRHPKINDDDDDEKVNFVKDVLRSRGRNSPTMATKRSSPSDDKTPERASFAHRSSEKSGKKRSTSPRRRPRSPKPRIPVPSSPERPSQSSSDRRSLSPSRRAPFSGRHSRSPNHSPSSPRHPSPPPRHSPPPKMRNLEKELELASTNWTRYRRDLDATFFADGSSIVLRSSPEYQNFWVFFEKFQLAQRKKLVAEMMSSSGDGGGGAADKNAGKHVDKDRPKASDVPRALRDLPSKFDKRYKVNFSLLTEDLKRAQEVRYDWRGQIVDGEQGFTRLSKDLLVEFRSILHYYCDFVQKQHFAKLNKMKQDQSALPMFHYKEEVIEAVRANQVVIVAGDTGCGKSTQVPQYLMEAGYERVACTQPRRIACMALARRVAYETLNAHGTKVGYQIRFEKKKSSHTRLLFLTEGVLLRQITTDPLLKEYSVIVLDEVHERHLFGDFLLGILRQLLTHRRDLKLVLMSATINIDLFSNYFDKAPVISVPGRLYPIQMEYHPPKPQETHFESKKSSRLNPAPFLRILQLIDKKYPPDERGDLLIFVSGMNEIQQVVDAARQYALETEKWIILPLHSNLSIEDQDKVFDVPPEGVRKCVVSTNIAETSVTIDGIRFILDSGKVKEMNFDPQYKMQKLQEFWISAASANQRKGRAGRTGPGVCFRLYDESDYESFQSYPTPEIQRVPLDSLVLQMLAMGLPDPRLFPFLESPDAGALENAISYLKEQGAITQEETLTPIGAMLAQMPVDVIIGKILLMGALFHMVDPVLTIAAALSVQSPFTMRAHSDSACIAARNDSESEHGDPMTLLNVFDEWIQVKAEGRDTKKWCKRRGLEQQRLYEMVKLKNQFFQILKEQGFFDSGNSDAQDATNVPDENETKDQRKQKYLQKRQFVELKKEEDKQQSKRKLLKFNENTDISVHSAALIDEEEDENMDDDGDLSGKLKDLDFRLKFDVQKLAKSSGMVRELSVGNLTLLKIIISAGLYPQIAIPDQTNSFKKDSEQMFHTRFKGFVVLHPTSVFSRSPNLLRPPDIHVENKVKTDESTKSVTTESWSHKHEILVYVSLLETKKPYLTNILRVPALQFLLLFGSFIDTNTSVDRILVDSWLELTFSSPDDGQQVLSAVVALRDTWSALLNLKLDRQTKVKDVAFDQVAHGIKVNHVEKKLCEKLVQFLQSEIKYTFRRVLPAEQAHLYVGPGAGDTKAESLKNLANPSNFAPHPTKGGLAVNSYLTHGCLVDNDVAKAWSEYGSNAMLRHWTCPKCDVHMIVSVIDRLNHERTCVAGGDDSTSSATVEEIVKRNEETQLEANSRQNRKPFLCDECGQTFMFTPVESLKHRRSCGQPV